MILLHDTVTATRRVWTGERDSRGNKIYEDQEVPYRAEVRPMDTRENPIQSGTVVTTRYRVILGPDADLTSADAITWNGLPYEILGELEQHNARGRTHHHEAIMARRTG